MITIHFSAPNFQYETHESAGHTIAKIHKIADRGKKMPDFSFLYLQFIGIDDKIMSGPDFPYRPYKAERSQDPASSE
jgi:hypothetical protein